MTVSIVQVGNSRGIRLPQNILRELNIQDEVEMVVKKNELVIKSVKKKPRKGWNKAFTKMSEDKADKLLLPENIDSEVFEWVW